MAKKEKDKMPDDFDMLKTIRSEKIYKSNIVRRDKTARKYLNENNINGGRNVVSKVFLGQMLMFDYLTPKTLKDLEYYDAMPCTIFLGVRKTEEGPRVIGFNIHYYPPRIRYRLMDKVFTIFKSSYTNRWSKPLNKEIPVFSYELFMYQLKNAKLDFGVRMYIPKLMAQITPVPPNSWHKAVFTEGAFKKTTREAIMNYWRRKIDNKKYR